MPAVLEPVGLVEPVGLRYVDASTVEGGGGGCRRTGGELIMRKKISMGLRHQS